MNMKKHILFLMLCIWSGITVSAQDTRQYFQEIRFGAGIRRPVRQTSGWGSSEILSLSYAHYNQSGIGIRTGVEFMPENMDVDSYFGVPVALSFRTRTYSVKESVMIGLESAAYGAVRDAYYGHEPSVSSVLGDFLLGLFNKMDFYVGLTPGYIAGTNDTRHRSYSGDWITEGKMEVLNRFSLTADAGFSMSVRIWRFNLGFVPAVHYYLTKNYLEVSQTAPVVSDTGVSSTRTETPVRFQFSVLGALSFSF